MHLALNELFDIDGTIDAMSREAIYIWSVFVLLMLGLRSRGRTLEDFEVLQICIFGVDVELDSSHGDIKVDTIEDLAERRATQKLAVVPEGYGDWGLWGRGRTYPVPHCSTLVMFS